MNSEREFTFNGYTYGHFFHIFFGQLIAEQNCIAWGGNLTTIKSLQVDSLLQYLPDSPDQFECWIGLNDIDTQAVTDVSVYVWVDGSNSTFRNFAATYPMGLSTQGCIVYGFNQDDTRGWSDKPCIESATCYFCNKPSVYIMY